MKEGIVQMRDIKEMIRVIDAKEEEIKQARKKLECKHDFIDMDARDSLRASEV